MKGKEKVRGKVSLGAERAPQRPGTDRNVSGCNNHLGFTDYLKGMQNKHLQKLKFAPFSEVQVSWQL